MKEVGARDRLVMAGLVLLGLVTVIAGVLSGRSTINYVLARDAREAALSWAHDLNDSLSELGPHAPLLLDRDLDILNAEAFAAQTHQPAALPESSRGTTSPWSRISTASPRGGCCVTFPIRKTSW